MIHELGARYYYLPWVLIRKTRDDVKFWNCDIYKPFGANDPPRLPARVAPDCSRCVVFFTVGSVPLDVGVVVVSQDAFVVFLFHALSLGSAGRTASA